MTDREQNYAVKTLDEINLTFNEEMAKRNSSETVPRKKCCSALKVISDILFYIAILAILYSVLSVDVLEGSPRNIMGYSYFTVMSSSMESEIPKGSLIIIRGTEPSQLEIGDNITYLKENGTTVTHKIIEIIDSQSGAFRKFRTKGVNNSTPDNYTVNASDVLGRVVFVLPGTGSLIYFVNRNIHIVLILFLLCSLISFLLRGVFGRKQRMEVSQ